MTPPNRSGPSQAWGLPVGLVFPQFVPPSFSNGILIISSGISSPLHSVPIVLAWMWEPGLDQPHSLSPEYSRCLSDGYMTWVWENQMKSKEDFSPGITNNKEDISLGLSVSYHRGLYKKVKTKASRAHWRRRWILATEFFDSAISERAFSFLQTNGVPFLSKLLLRDQKVHNLHTERRHCALRLLTENL